MLISPCRHSSKAKSATLDHQQIRLFNEIHTLFFHSNVTTHKARKQKAKNIFCLRGVKKGAQLMRKKNKALDHEQSNEMQMICILSVCVYIALFED